MSSAQTFTPNERVLCYHGPLIYEAKVLKAETWDERTTQTGVVGAHYYVHYKGWKQTWDEWVDASRLLKFNETNIALQKALQSQSQAAQAASASSSKAAKAQQAKDAAGGGRLGARKDGARGTKRGREEVSVGDFAVDGCGVDGAARAGRGDADAGDEAERAGAVEGPSGGRLGGGHEELPGTSAAAQCSVSMTDGQYRRTARWPPSKTQRRRATRQVQVPSKPSFTQ